MRRPASLAGFFGRGICAFALLTALWLPISDQLARPVGWAAHVVLGNWAPDWVIHVDRTTQQVVLLTRIEVASPDGRIGQLVVDAVPARQAYGLPLLLALLLAAGSPRFVRGALFGFLLLLPCQATSLVFDLLKQIMMAAPDPSSLGVAAWRLEAIALGYQFGSLLLPTVAPMLIWLWLDRGFLMTVVATGWLRREVLGNGSH